MTLIVCSDLILTIALIVNETICVRFLNAVVSVFAMFVFLCFFLFKISFILKINNTICILSFPFYHKQFSVFCDL